MGGPCDAVRDEALATTWTSERRRDKAKAKIRTSAAASSPCVGTSWMSWIRALSLSCLPPGPLNERARKAVCPGPRTRALDEKDVAVAAGIPV